MAIAKNTHQLTERTGLPLSRTNKTRWADRDWWYCNLCHNKIFRPNAKIKNLTIL